jgi:predicted nucleic acid-binding protein
MVVIDSSIWIDFLGKKQLAQSQELEGLLTKQLVLVPDLVVAEVLRGLPDNRAARQVEQEFAKNEIVVVGGWGLALRAAENFRFLRSKAFTIRSTVDLFVGTWCIENELPLLHFDRDFAAMETHLGLKVWRGEDPSPSLA